jgi:hypothetical protein
MNHVFIYGHSGSDFAPNYSKVSFYVGDEPIGEVFSPGFDCSKILDSNPQAKDGMYWIHLGGYYPKQVHRNNVLKYNIKNII